MTSVANTTDSGTQTFAYTHDGNGNILSENSVSYGYDALNRLTSWVHDGVTTSYDYDDAGNLQEVANDTIPVKTFTYNAANQITNTGFSYDANGNMTSDGDQTYVYDGDNRLIEVKEGATTIAAYAYDYMGRRTSVTESGNTTYYHYDGWNVVAETNSSGATIATYAYDNTNQPISMTRSGQTYYYQTNAHGDVMTLTDSTGAVVNTYSYDPWGKVIPSSETVENPYRYAGYRYDEGTGLYYLQARYYSPTIARFITKDAATGNLKKPIGLNKYIYCENNPINMTDTAGQYTNAIHYEMTKEVVFKVAMEFGFSEASAANMAIKVAQADKDVDKLFKGFKCRGHHLNMNIISSGTSMENWSAYYWDKALFEGNRNESLKYLGYGLHSVQDQAGHSKFPITGTHLGPFYNPDADLSPSRKAAVRNSTEAYVRSYFSSMSSQDNF